MKLTDIKKAPAVWHWLLLLLLLITVLSCAVPAQARISPTRLAYPLPVIAFAEPLPEQAVRALPPIIITGQQARLYSATDNNSFRQRDLPAGSRCYLIQSWAGEGRYHLILTGERTWYISSGQLALPPQSGYVFHPQQHMRTRCGYSAAQIESLLKGGLKGMGGVFAQAEQRYQVNALLLLGICVIESGWADSHLARYYHNLAGLGGSGAFMRFESNAACVDYLARLLSERYLNPDSSFYHGDTISAISVTYCSNSYHWTNNISRFIERSVGVLSSE